MYSVWVLFKQNYLKKCIRNPCMHVTICGVMKICVCIRTCMCGREICLYEKDLCALIFLKFQRIKLNKGRKSQPKINISCVCVRERGGVCVPLRRSATLGSLCTGRMSSSTSVCRPHSGLAWLIWTQQHKCTVFALKARTTKLSLHQWRRPEASCTTGTTKSLYAPLNAQVWKCIMSQCKVPG